MRASIEFDAVSMQAFYGKVATTISKVGRGTKKATEQACNDIMNASLELVPIETATLASAASYTIGGNYKDGFYGTVGYCIDKDPINPLTGKSASSYVLAVHEDLYAKHPIGQAKFLEQAVTDYATDNFPRTVMKHLGSAIIESGGEV